MSETGTETLADTRKRLLDEAISRRMKGRANSYYLDDIKLCTACEDRLTRKSDYYKMVADMEVLADEYLRERDTKAINDDWIASLGVFEKQFNYWRCDSAKWSFSLHWNEHRCGWLIIRGVEIVEVQTRGDLRSYLRLQGLADVVRQAELAGWEQTHG